MSGDRSSRLSDREAVGAEVKPQHKSCLSKYHKVIVALINIKQLLTVLASMTHTEILDGYW